MKTTFITRRNCKKTAGGPKVYHIENNLALASFAASSLYGILLHAAETV